MTENSLASARELAVGHIAGRVELARQADLLTLKTCFRLQEEGFDVEDDITFWAEVCRVNDEVLELLLDTYGYTKLQLEDYLRIG